MTPLSRRTSACNLAAFLVHVVTTPARGREALDIAMSMIQDRAGNAANVGKTRVYTRAGGPAPPGIAELGDRVSTGNAPEAERDFSPWAHPSATPLMSRRTRTRACGRRHSCCTNSPSCLTCNVRGSLLPCVLPRLQITCYAPCLPTFQHPMHVATMLQCCSACVTGHEDPDITAARLGGVGLQCAEGLRPAQFDLPELGRRRLWGLCSRGPSLEMSSFGTLFKVSTFGESHGVGVGCIVDGIPANLALTEEDVQPQLTRRRPGQSSLTTARSVQFGRLAQPGLQSDCFFGAAGGRKEAGKVSCPTAN
eukprot:s4094_g6.t1